MAERVVGIHEAKKHFSKLVKQVQAGDTIVISRYGKPVARIIPFDGSKEQRSSRLRV